MINQSMNRILTCRLCWILARNVFLLILVIEGLILIPSAYKFRSDMLAIQKEKVAAIVETALLVPIENNLEILKQRLSRLQSFDEIKGLSIINSKGQQLTVFGEQPYEELLLSNGISERGDAAFKTDVTRNDHRDITLTTRSAGESLTVLMRLDIAHINSALTSFTLRIAGLIGIIVIFVTAGTMFVTSQLVLMPILQLRRSLFSLAADPDNIENYHIKSNAQGEMNDILSAHNKMLTEVANSRRLDKERTEESTSFLVRHDPLTQLPNRKLFLEHLSKVLVDAKESGNIIHVLVIVFSDFRRINDAYGQNVTNQLIISTAKILDAFTNSNLFVAQINSDEFVIADRNSEGSVQVAALVENILAICANPLMIDGMSLNLRGRVGIACSSDNWNAEHLLQNAKTALRVLLDNLNLHEKYRFYASDMPILIRQKQEIERDLRHAINHNQLSLFYQPKITLNFENPVCAFSSCEALIRWHHPTKGLLSPGEFISIAEKSELIFPLGEWVLREACMQIKLWRKAGFVIPRVAVNLSARQFLDPKLPELVSDIIKSSGVNADDLELEITESAAMSDIQTSIVTLEKLRQIGVRLSIDDFGTGHSSLGYLQKLKVNSLKIDKTFIDGIGSDENANLICDAIIRLGHSLGLKITAEGVENNVQLDFLRQRHCDEVQGFLFAHPMSAVDLTKKLKLGAHE